jgi:hypothetical protein
MNKFKTHIMETLINIDVLKLKEDIKAIAAMQKFYRNQRKAVHVVGERKLPAKEAGEKYDANKEKLRAMYAAYGLGRGHAFSVTENHYPEVGHPLEKIKYRIDKIISNYLVLEAKEK